MKSAGKARNNGLYRHIRTSKEIIRNLLNDSVKTKNDNPNPSIISGTSNVAFRHSTKPRYRIIITTMLVK